MKKQYVIITLVLLVIGLVALLVGKNQTKLSKQSLISNSSTETSISQPLSAVFMRKGEIWRKDFNTKEERKISQKSGVIAPFISPSGKHVLYYDINPASDGFPSASVYLNNLDTKSEVNLGKTNPYASNPQWSKDDNVLGLVLFSSVYNPEALLFDTISQQVVLKKSLANNNVIQAEEFKQSLGCNNLAEKYRDFCNTFNSVISKKRIPTESYYKREKYDTAVFKKTDYHLISSKKLDNSLVVLEFYKGKPLNIDTESMGGGTFTPGYDEGVDETYTLLINEKDQRILQEIPMAVNTMFVF